ncbi:unnamed protein product [Parajaminaea phylloscopi]
MTCRRLNVSFDAEWRMVDPPVHCRGDIGREEGFVNDTPCIISLGDSQECHSLDSQSPVRHPAPVTLRTADRSPGVTPADSQHLVAADISDATHVSSSNGKREAIHFEYPALEPARLTLERGAVKRGQSRLCFQPCSSPMVARSPAASVAQRPARLGDDLSWQDPPAEILQHHNPPHDALYASALVSGSATDFDYHDVYNSEPSTRSRSRDTRPTSLCSSSVSGHTQEEHEDRRSPLSTLQKYQDTIAPSLYTSQPCWQPTLDCQRETSPRGGALFHSPTHRSAWVNDARDTQVSITESSEGFTRPLWISQGDSEPDPCHWQVPSTPVAAPSSWGTRPLPEQDGNTSQWYGEGHRSPQTSSQRTTGSTTSLPSLGRLNDLTPSRRKGPGIRATRGPRSFVLRPLKHGARDVARKRIQLPALTDSDRTPQSPVSSLANQTRPHVSNGDGNESLPRFRVRRLPAGVDVEIHETKSLDGSVKRRLTLFKPASSSSIE